MGKWSDKNISAGGHVYDKNTGTWVGETQGTVGGGYTGDGVGRPSMVIHDANGPVGVVLAPRGTQQVAAGHAGTGSGGSGPGAASVQQGGGSDAGGAGPGSAVVVAGPLEPKLKPTHTQLLLGGTGWTHNPNWSDTAEWEERYGEPGDWLGGIVTMGVDLGTNARRIWNKWDAHVQAQPAIQGGNAWVTSGAADWWEQANSPWGPDKPIAGFDSGGF